MQNKNPVAETIFALASAPGRAGVAVIRISGVQAGAALQHITRRPLPAPRMVSLGDFFNQAGERIDRGLTLWFPAPNSFTGEDVAELHIHGGRALLHAVTETLAAIPGLRLAEPGEFTRRAFAGGKMDLTEAEAIADLVDAETTAQMHQALRQMDGALGRLYETWRAALLRALAHIEASIDFADEELPTDLAAARAQELAVLQQAIATHLDDHRRGEKLRDGFHIAILGAPNAGKSSLLNTLAQRDAAIVAATAGTTRDVIEVHLDLGGYPVIVADTAGLRDSADAIENEGIRRAQSRAAQADLKILLFDATALPALDATTLALRDDHSMVVVNKTDLLTTAPQTPADVLPLSLRTSAGLPEFLAALTARVAEELADTGMPALTRARHRAGLEQCRAHLARALGGLQNNQEMALVAEDIRLAMRALGRITGTVDVEDLLDVIFRDFCIGK
ncbi:MAG: tRNA uridine-5-carboxymethylaminomethyl(34) synthesis GTPase MnmE [Alphaproteobacteria bacterium]